MDDPDRYVDITTDPRGSMRYDIVTPHRKVTFSIDLDDFEECEIGELVSTVQRLWRIAVELGEKKALW
tara:strand:+ start:16029 stop:16232 length:204 start_codon:yes stop_codon:yes gene_type:complete